MQITRALCVGQRQTHAICSGNRLLRCARGGAGTRPECELRAVECLLASPCARPRLEGEGRGPREPREADALGDDELRPAERHPPEDVCPRAARGHAANLSSRPLRPRWLGVRVLRLGEQPPYARPRRAALSRGHVRVGERRHLVRSLQPQQGRPSPRGDEHDAPNTTSPADARALHPPDGGAHPRDLAHLPPGHRRLIAGGNDESRGETMFPPAIIGTWRVPLLPAPRARARPRIVRGRGPLRRFARSRGLGSP